MLGLLLVFWIGRSHYKLAEQYNRNKWVFAILSIVVFYGIQLVAGLIYGVFIASDSELMNMGTGAEMALNLAGVVLGGLAVLLFYNLLKRNWSQENALTDTGLLDEDLIVRD